MEPLRRWDPEQIGGYTLVGRLGAGAMGQVYLGRSAAGRLVAVKTIRIELAEEPEFRSRFAQEVAAARRVSGVFTAAVVAADPEADVPWLATAYIAAPSLSTLTRRCGALSVPAVRWLAAGCAEALESIHGAGLVHRDLKPSNVLVSTDGPRVIDFGLARADGRIQLTLTRSAVGTPAYMAPEQARDARRATIASDVYSLGATMVLAATGHPPYQGDTVMDILVRLATEPPDLSGLPADLTDIVRACLERDPVRRPTAAAVVRTLAQDVRPATDARELGPEYLSRPALELLAHYRNGPGPPSRPADQEPVTDDTFGSLPVAADEQASTVRSGQTRIRTALLAMALSVIALALVAAGTVIGISLASSGSGVSAGTTGAGNTPPPGFLPAPGLGPPPQATQAQGSDAGGKPTIVMNQPWGDSQTVFVIRGTGWPAGQRVSITLEGAGVAPEHPVVDEAGIFSYAINQNHEFFRAGLPLRTYQVVVTAAGGERATASFLVNRP